MIVDTSVWIDYIEGSIPAGNRNWQSDYLNDAIKTKQLIYTTPIIIQEVLQGLLDDKRYNRFKASLLSYKTLMIDPVDLAVASANLHRQLRKQGITIRKANDCQIAYLALYYDVELLHKDKDFKHIATHTALKEVKKV